MKASSGVKTERSLQWQPIRMIETPLIRHGLTLLALAYLFWSVCTLDMDWSRMAVGLPRAKNMIVRMIPPDFSRAQLLARGILESVQMALTATFLGMTLAIPLGICGAANLVPRPIYLIARTLIILSRTFHEIIIGFPFRWSVSAIVFSFSDLSF
jgi:phosphonate transport system permease protein